MKSITLKKPGEHIGLAWALTLSFVFLALASTAGAQDADFIRPRQEGTFKARVGTPQIAQANVLGQFKGYEIAEVPGPAPMLSMGKAVAVDPAGNLWFVDSREDKAVRLNPRTLEMTEFGVPKGAAPYSVAVDSKGTVWMTAHGIEMLLELRPEEGVVVSHAPPTHGFLIHIRVDQRNDTVYFGQPGANKIVAYNRKSGFREFTIPTDNSGPGRIDIEPNGTVWFTELYANKIARLDPASGKIEEWEIPLKNSLPAFCRVDKSGVIWISEPMADAMQLFKDGKFIKTFKIPTVNSVVSTSIEDRDGAVWFTEGGWRGSSGGNKIGWLNPATGSVEEFVLPTLNAQPLGIAMDNDGGMWFEESTLGKLIRIKKSEVAKSQNTK
jgi:virginiamycin B lyase